jgi:hypothetical protein
VINTKVGSFFLIMSLVCFLTSPVYGGKISREIFETSWNRIVKVWGKNTIKKGAQKSLKSRMKKIVAKYGDNIYSIVQKSGPSGIQAIEKHGDNALRAISKYGKSAVAPLNRIPKKSFSTIVKQYGDNSVGTIIKHPGVGKMALDRFGRNAIDMGNKFKTSDMTRILRIYKNAPEVSKSKKAKEFAEMIIKGGVNIIDFIEKHPLTILGGSTVIYFINNPDDLEASSEKIAPALENIISGVSKGITKGTISGVGQGMSEGGVDPTMVVIVLIVVGFLSFIVIRIYKIKRVEDSKLEIEKVRILPLEQSQTPLITDVNLQTEKTNNNPN